MKDKINIFNKYLIFERDINLFYVSFNREFIKKVKGSKRYRQRKTSPYYKFYTKKPLRGQIKRSMRGAKLNKI